MTERRDTLVTLFKRHGYRAVAVMPGTWQSWPEGAFYGFDDIYGGARLDYRGPVFGWWDMTDQFVLARMNALEVSRASRPPLFVFFPTISTHVPFTPIPPYQPDWARVLTDDPYDEQALNHAYLREPDWMDLGSSYPDALSYTYQSLAGYLRLRGQQEFVMILLGDHQPAAAVSGEAASWDVPMHVVASRRPVLDRLLGHGFRSGLDAGSAVARSHAHPDTRAGRRVRGSASFDRGTPALTHQILKGNEWPGDGVVNVRAAMRNLVAGAIAAGAIAVLLATVTFGGQNGWKFALAAVGLVLWVLGGLAKDSKGRDGGIPRMSGKVLETDAWICRFGCT